MSKAKVKKPVKKKKTFKYEVVLVRRLVEAVTVEVEADSSEQASEKAYELMHEGVLDEQWEFQGDDTDVDSIEKL